MKRNGRKSRSARERSSFSSFFLSLARCRVVGLKMRKRDDEFIDCLSTRGKALKQLSPNGGGEEERGLHGISILRKNNVGRKISSREFSKDVVVRKVFRVCVP